MCFPVKQVCYVVGKPLATLESKVYPSHISLLPVGVRRCQNCPPSVQLPWSGIFDFFPHVPGHKLTRFLHTINLRQCPAIWDFFWKFFLVKNVRKSARKIGVTK